MNSLMKLDYAGSPVRIVDRDGNLWFVAKDVCDILGYTDARRAVFNHCKKDALNKHTLSIETIGGKQNAVIISELNLNRLIMRSRKKEAEKFQDWICGEVIPSIRKTGTYSIQQPKEQQPTATLETTQMLQELKEALPAIRYIKNTVEVGDNTNLRDTAKILEIGQNKFIEKLIAGYFLYRDGHNQLRPFSNDAKRGLFVLKFYEIEGKMRPQTFVTPKGIQFFAMLKDKGEFE